METKNNKLILAAGAIVLIIILFFVFSKREGGGEGAAPGTQEFPGAGKGLPCPGETLTRTMSDPYMRGIIEQDKPYKVIMNYYACNLIKKGDYVLYRYSNSLEPVVRIVKAVAGDKVELTPDKKHKAWHVLVNGDYVMSGDEKHFVGAETPTVMHLGLKPRKNILGANDVVVLSSWPPGDKDSGIFGIVSIVDIIGKVEVIAGDSSVKSEEKKPTDKLEEKDVKTQPAEPAKENPEGAPVKKVKKQKVNKKETQNVD